jgi:hypothetical protein
MYVLMYLKIFFYFVSLLPLRLRLKAVRIVQDIANADGLAVQHLK